MAPPQREKKTVPIDDLVVTEQVVRETDECHIEFLMPNIDKEGLRHGIPVVALPGGKYQPYGGFHRLEACRRLGHTHIEIEVYPQALDVNELLVVSIVDNLGQKGLTLAEKVKSVATLKRQSGWKNAEIARRLGLKEYEVSNILAVVENAIPEVVEMMTASKIQDTAAVEVSRLPHDQQREVLRRAVVNGSTIKRDRIRPIIRELRRGGGNKRGPKPKGTRATIDVLDLKSTSSDVQELLAADRKFRRALIWLKRNKLKATPENLAEALSRAAKKSGPDKAA